MAYDIITWCLEQCSVLYVVALLCVLFEAVGNARVPHLKLKTYQGAHSCLHVQ